MNLFYPRYINPQVYQGKFKMAFDNKRSYESMTECGLITVKFHKSVVNLQKALKGEIKSLFFCTISKIPTNKTKKCEKGLNIHKNYYIQSRTYKYLCTSIGMVD